MHARVREAFVLSRKSDGSDAASPNLRCQASARSKRLRRNLCWRTSATAVSTTISC